jgi:short-subunit dehydrogenase
MPLQSRKMAAALITGASTGMGREFAYLCAQAGYDVVVVSRSEAETGRTGAPKGLYDDVVCSKIPVEVLINNALSRLLLPLMIANKRGKILNVASTAAFRTVAQLGWKALNAARKFLEAA